MILARKLLVFVGLFSLGLNVSYAISSPNQYTGNTPQVKITTTISATVQQSLSSSGQSVTTLQTDESSAEASAGTTLSTPFAIESNSDEPYVLSAQSVDSKNQATSSQLDYGSGVSSDYTVSYTPCSGGKSVPLSGENQVLENSQINAEDCQNKSGQLNVNIDSASSDIPDGATAEGNVALIVQQQ